MSSSSGHKRSLGSDQPLYFPLLQGRIIRLLQLHPGSWSDPISINIFITELEFAPQYEALSYVWGDPLERVPILCNGRTLKITRNLHSAFRRVRLHDRPRVLWADAVCINQQHLVERSHHVAFMGDIYSLANKVLVCLGKDPDGGAEDVASLVTEYATMISKHNSIPSMPILKADDPVYDDPRWKALATLLSNVWFTRSWVIQEVGLATDPRVLYGIVEFSYRELMLLNIWIVRCAPSLEAKANVLVGSIHTDWADWSIEWKKASTYPDQVFLDLLNHSRGLECSDPRDRVYAYLGHPLARDYPGRELIVVPDYTKSVREVYLDLGVQLVNKHGYRLLSAVEHDDQSLWEDMPSWVPNWSGAEYTTNSFGIFTEFYYQASSGVESQRPVVDSENRLRVQGVAFDKVSACYCFTDVDIASPDDLKSASSSRHAMLKDIWAKAKYQVQNYAYSHSDVLDALSLTLCGGLFTFKPAEENMSEHRQDRAAYFSLLGPTIGCEDLGEEPELASQGDPERYWVDMKLGIIGRSFVFTEKGYFGLAPHIIQPGDLICIFFGATVPFALRTADLSEPDMFKLIGECYVHGLMRGEAFSTQSRGDSSETFVLC